MKIIPNHNKVSRPVESWEEIRDIADELYKLTQGEFTAGQTAYAVHHSQVSEDPFNFFTVHEKIVKMGMFPGIVINPEVLAGDQSAENTVRTTEGCLSFPYRKHKSVDRLFKIEVQYQLPITMEVKKEALTGLAAQMFQHEVLHAQGANIFGMTRD